MAIRYDNLKVSLIRLSLTSSLEFFIFLLDCILTWPPPMNAVQCVTSLSFQGDHFSSEKCWFDPPFRWQNTYFLYHNWKLKKYLLCLTDAGLRKSHVIKNESYLKPTKIDQKIQIWRVGKFQKHRLRCFWNFLKLHIWIWWSIFVGLRYDSFLITWDFRSPGPIADQKYLFATDQFLQYIPMIFFLSLFVHLVLRHIFATGFCTYIFKSYTSGFATVASTFSNLSCFNFLRINWLLK